MSSFDYSKTADSTNEPIVVVPETTKEEDEESEVAGGLELARRQMQGLKVADDDFTLDFTPTKVTDKYAYAFDIDGVLIKGGEVIPEAIHAMKMLNGQNSKGIKVLVAMLEET
jgi:hypothetical protein